MCAHWRLCTGVHAYHGVFPTLVPHPHDVLANFGWVRLADGLLLPRSELVRFVCRGVLSPDPGHGKVIIEVLVLKEETVGQDRHRLTRLEQEDLHIASEAYGQVEIGIGLSRHLLRCVDHAMSCSNPKDAAKDGRCLLGRTTWTRCRCGVRSDHIMAYTNSDLAADRDDRRWMSQGMLVHIGLLLRAVSPSS